MVGVAQRVPVAPFPPDVADRPQEFADNKQISPEARLMELRRQQAELEQYLTTTVGDDEATNNVMTRLEQIRLAIQSMQRPDGPALNIQN